MFKYFRNLRTLFIAGSAAFVMHPAHAQNAALAQQNFQQADASGDGDLTYDEFVVFINLNADDKLGNAARIRNAKMHKTAFKRLDANGDNIVTQTELVQASQ